MGRAFLCGCASVWLASVACAQAPPGLDGRAPIGPYLNNRLPPMSGAFAFPPVLSATGAFRDLSTLTPIDALVPFTVNSPLWSDGALKTRWMAVPNDGAPYTPAEQINFVPMGEWTFPNGTVFVKHFELIVDEATGARKRLETRLLVRNAEGAVYGVTYKWRPDESDADLLPGGFEEDIAITNASGVTRLQRYSYPSRADCLFCHNQQANYVLGPKTHQLNGNFTYPSTGRTDNQLRTLNHLGLFNPALREENFATYPRAVAVSDPTATVQHRMRSWIDANCSHCHRPGGFGPGYDGRFNTPLENQNLLNSYVKFRDLAGSPLHQRDNALDQFKMPPLAKNVVHETAMRALRQWIASPLEVLSVFLFEDTSHLLVRFNSHVDPGTAASASNYALDRGATVSAAALGPEPDTVLLTVSPLLPNESYRLMLTGVQDTAPSANTIWPGTRSQFIAQYPPAPGGTQLANVSARVQVGTGDDVAISGFIIRGQSPKRVLLRALGPSLGASGISDGLADPVLELHDRTGALIATNDNWDANTNQQEIIDTGLAPASANEAAILARLPADADGVGYTAILRGAHGATGSGLLELYDLDRRLGPDLLNLSTRGRVGLGDQVLIGGFIISGPGPKKVLVRALGPSLPLAGKVPDPTVELFNRDGTRIAFNDDWRSHQEAEILASTLAPANELESAIVATLPPTPHTAIVRGAGGTTGVGLIEIYSLH